MKMPKRLCALTFSCLVSVCFLGYAQEPAADCQKLKEDYERLGQDRDNLLQQVKNLLHYREQIRAKEDEIKALQQKIASIDKDKDTVGLQIADLKDQLKAAQDDKLELIAQVESLKKHIEKREIEYKIVDDLKRDLQASRREEGRLQTNMLELSEQVKKAESERLAAKADAEIYRRQVRSLKQEYTEALQANKRLEKELAEIPKKFAEIARENKVLIKETALMHYNLGVFYIGEGQYKRAIAELEKACELNPDDAYAYFNLGYIYAEYLVNRPKAIEYFQHYLKLAHKEDKEIDWVKKYIVTWQAWEGKKPIN